ncbi:FxsA family protein [Ornithinimicrobium pratense]|uniref:FxsA family protein n=1 Tax=Ornithinimicrobium pratense TaxID=2593973 RepID=A0A5J6V3W0_9MICO|nr:FxsA family protein [Ornithinimicrobium pratense]QFG68640.1 FxsA family protein [Ornithinimicrobium pratense]
MSTPGPTPRRRGGLLRWLLLALVILPFAEVAALVLVGRTIGFWWTLGALVAVAVVGVLLVRHETSRTYKALQETLNSGKMPADEVTDAILVMIGGFLLILPGFVSDAAGLLLVLPFTRPVARRMLQAFVASRAVAVVGPGAPPPAGGGARRSSGRGQVIEGEVVAEQQAPGTPEAGGPRQLDR